MERRLKKSLLIVVLSCLLISGCETSKSEPAKEQKPRVESRSQEAKLKEEKASIPQSLFPGNGDGEKTETTPSSGALTSQTEVWEMKEEPAKPANVTKKKEPAAPNVDTGKKEEADNTVISVSLQVESAAAEAYGYSVYYESDITLGWGASVYDALAVSGIEFAGGSYISGIGGLFEADCEPQSGWTYLVNGTRPNTGCQNYILEDGDVVIWSYVLQP